jgi:addiction module RelE/StbE family toxin
LKREVGSGRKDREPSRKRPLEVVYLPVAIQDLFEIIEYVRKDNPSAAADLVKRFDEALGKLGSFPEIGPVPKDERLSARGYRVLVIDNYLAFYVIREKVNIVEVRRVLHGRRMYSFLL